MYKGEMICMWNTSFKIITDVRRGRNGWGNRQNKVS